MKKSELRQIIREVIKEQLGTAPITQTQAGPINPGTGGPTPPPQPPTGQTQGMGTQPENPFKGMNMDANKLMQTLQGAASKGDKLAGRLAQQMKGTNIKGDVGDEQNPRILFLLGAIFAWFNKNTYIPGSGIDWPGFGGEV